MKLVKKIAAITLIGAMMATTVQTAAPNVTKAQISYKTNKVKIDTSLVPQDENIEIKKEGDTPIISTLANVQFDLDCNVDCKWAVEPEEAIKSETGADKVTIDEMGHVEIGIGAAPGTYKIIAQAKNVENDVTEAIYRVTVREDEAVKAKNITLDKEKIENQSSHVKVTNGGKGLEIEGTVENVKLYTKVEPEYLLENNVDFESNKFVTMSNDYKDGTKSLLTSVASGKGTIKPKVGGQETDVSYETVVNKVAYKEAEIKCEEKENNDGYNILANEKLNFYIKDNEENALPQIDTENVKWTMTYGDGEKIIQGESLSQINTKLGTFSFSNKGKKVQLKTPIKGESSYEEYKKQIEKEGQGSNQITLVASIPYSTSGTTGTKELELAKVTLSFSSDESSFSDVGLDFEKAGLIKGKDFSVREETINGEKVPVYYFENSNSVSDTINLWDATHADREEIRKFEESRYPNSTEGYPFDKDTYYPINYWISSDDAAISSLNDKYKNDEIIKGQTNASGMVSNPGKLQKKGIGYTVLTMETKNGSNSIQHKYILRFVSSAKNMEIRHTQYSDEDAEYNNNAVIHVRQGEADVPTFYISGLKKQLDLLCDPFVEFSYKEIRGKDVVSATYDSATGTQKINGLSAGKVKVTATSIVDKTKKTSYILYVNDELLEPEQIEIDNSDAVSLGVMDAKGNVNGHYENIPLKVRATGTSAGVPPVIWSSEDEKFATITQDGLLTTLKSTGDKTVTITATSKANSDLKATLELHIKDVTATGISLIAEKVKEGENAVVTMGGTNAGTCKAYTTFQLYAKEYLPVNATKADGQIIWDSSDKTVAAIDNSGNVTTYGEGNTVITAKYTSGDTDSKTTVFNLTVKGFADAIESIECNSIVELTRVKDSFTLIPIVKPDNATNKQLMYESKNTAIATVTNTGVITAVSPGTTTIVISSLVKPSVKKEVMVTVKGEADLKPNSTAAPTTQLPAPATPMPTPNEALTNPNMSTSEKNRKRSQL